MIRHILFDLDSTLYSINMGLEDDFFERLKVFTSAWLKRPWAECEPLRKEALTKYGTTLEWLIKEESLVDIDEYYAHVHPENEADSLSPDHALRRFLESLPCPCSVLTNAPRFHAERIIAKLELEGIFRNIFAVDASGIKGKPHPAAYNNALNTLALKAEEVLFVDDVPRYVEGYLALGGMGILLDENDVHKDYTGEKIRDLKELSNFFTC